MENLLDKYSAVVIVSGDGLLYEVIQGLFQRQAQCDIYTQSNIIALFLRILTKFAILWDNIKQKTTFFRLGSLVNPYKLNSITIQVLKKILKSVKKK